MDYSLETLKREYIDIVRNNFVIMTTNDSFNEQAANRLIDIFKKMNIYTYQIILKYQYQDNLYEILDKLLNYYATKKIVEVSVTFNPVHL